MKTEHDLLYAVLALRANLIQPEQFAQACRLWNRNPDQNLPRLLVEHDWLSPQDKPHLEYLRERNLARCEGSERQCLSDLADATVRSALADVKEPDFQSWLASTFPGPLWTEEPESRRKIGGMTLALGFVILLVLLGGLVVGVSSLFWIGRARTDREMARMMAMQAEERAMVERLRAEQNLQQARIAVDKQLEQAGERPPDDLRRMQLLDQALDFYEKALRETPDNKELRKALIKVYKEMAGLLEASGKPQEAKALLERMKRIEK